MRASAQPTNPQKAAGAVIRAPKINKACHPCRLRKVKCDAAVVGLPCSHCKSQQRVEDCVAPTRKARIRKGVNAFSSPGQSINVRVPSKRSQETQVDRRSPSDSLTGPDSGRTEPDLLYLRILNDAVDTPGSRHHSKPEEHLTPRNGLSTKLSQLDETDREYLIKKKVFDLPPREHLDVFVRTYFARVHPFCPVISPADFIRRYYTSDCSLLLLQVILTTASLHAPTDVLHACGFASRSAAQESFFCRARLLFDFAAEDDPLVMLQASIILTLLILDHPTDRDFSYWFHNAISLAAKLNIRDDIIENSKRPEITRVYRRIWWGLYTLDIFHVFLNTKLSRLIEDSANIDTRMEDDSDDEQVTGDRSCLLSAESPPQKASSVVLCELASLFGDCMSTVKSEQQYDPRQILQPVDAWRKSLPTKMHIADSPWTNLFYLNAQHSSHAECREWVKQRLRAAILKLDTIAMRVLTCDMLGKLPVPFLTTITMLLALHIEFALDPNESHLIHSVSRISIAQLMLVLNQGKEIPLFKRALPIFEQILSKHNLNLVQPSNADQAFAQPLQQNDPTTDASASLQEQVNGVSPQPEPWEHNPSLDVDFTGFDFLDEWQQFGQLDYFA